MENCDRYSAAEMLERHSADPLPATPGAGCDRKEVAPCSAGTVPYGPLSDAHVQHRVRHLSMRATGFQLLHKSCPGLLCLPCNSQHFTCSRKARHYGSDRHTRCVGYLAIAQIVDLAQHKRLAECSW